MPNFNFLMSTALRSPSLFNQRGVFPRDKLTAVQLWSLGSHIGEILHLDVYFIYSQYAKNLVPRMFFRATFFVSTSRRSRYRSKGEQFFLTEGRGMRLKRPGRLRVPFELWCLAELEPTRSRYKRNMHDHRDYQYPKRWMRPQKYRCCIEAKLLSGSWMKRLYFL